MPRREGVMPPRRSNRLKTWRQSHVDRLRFARQNRVGFPGWPEHGTTHSAPATQIQKAAFPTSACVMLETRLIEGMLLGRSAVCCRSHQQRCTGLRAALQLKQLSCEVQPRGELHEMRNILVKLFIGTAITSIAMFGADNSIGTWKRNIEESKSTPPATNPITSLTIVNEAVDGGVDRKSTRLNSSHLGISYSSTDKYDGKEYPATGAPWDTISMKQINANTFTVEVRKTGGKYHSTGRTVISKDGKSMTTTTKGTDAEGNPTSGTAIYEKQ